MSSDVTFSFRGVHITVLAGSYLRDGQPTEQAVVYAHDLFGRLDDLRQFAADHLFGIYNDAWSDEDEPPIDQESFSRELVNPAIVLLNEFGSACVYFEDSDLFCGHGIEVEVEGTTPKQATLVG